ncbi:MAG: DedA family protein [Gemmatimonadetes bacterium]|nr:DedA family protein [Gemmatimonadota bacterium]
MDNLLHELVRLLITGGPWIVLVVALSETAVFAGLLVPAEATVLVAAFLAQRGLFPLEHILLAAFFGGLLGDQMGYVFGRIGGARMAARGGFLGRLWQRHEMTAAGLFRRHSALAITFARFLSFVRTLMPWFAGMSRVPYGRFLLYDSLGVLGWAGGSVALGYLAGESWRMAASTLGTVGGAVLVLLVLAALLAARRRRESLVEAASLDVDPTEAVEASRVLSG